MGRRERRKDFWAGFIGNGEVTEENANSLLDNQLFPTELNAGDFTLFAPTPKRTQKGLKAVEKAVEAIGLDFTERYDPEGILDELITEREQNDNPLVYLIVLWDEQEETEALVRRALDHDIRVKDLCAALDDIEIGEDEPEPEQPKRRGKPRATEADVMEAKVEGPATVAPQGQLTSASILENAIRNMIREEIGNMGLSIGHNARQTDMDEQDEKVKAFVNDDGEYELAGDRKRAPRGKKAVELTKKEARDAGLDA